jgi:preprotein translocase subunit YajC
MDYLSLISIVLVFGIMYAVLIIPQRKREKKVRAMLDALKVDDMITTIGGIIGKVVNISDEGVTIETSIERTKLLMRRDSIRSVDAPPAAAE